MTPIQKLAKFLDVSMSSKDATRLKAHLGGWNLLNEILLLGNVCSPDLRRLILLEVQGKGRPDILRKLATRLASTEQEELWEQINACLTDRILD